MLGTSATRSMVLSFVLMQLCIGASEAVLNATREVITSPDVAKPISPYSQAICVGDTMYLAGQVGTDPQTKLLVPGGIVPETRQVLANLDKVLEAGRMNRTNVVRCTVYLADMKDFDDMNKVYGEFFSEEPPARVTVRVSELAKRARVEIDAIAVKTIN